MYILWTVAKYSAKLFSMAFDVGNSGAPSLTAPNYPSTHPHHHPKTTESKSSRLYIHVCRKHTSYMNEILFPKQMDRVKVRAHYYYHHLDAYSAIG